MEWPILREGPRGPRKTEKLCQGREGRKVLVGLRGGTWGSLSRFSSVGLERELTAMTVGKGLGLAVFCFSSMETVCPRNPRDKGSGLE